MGVAGERVSGEAELQVLGQWKLCFQPVECCDTVMKLDWFILEGCETSCGLITVTTTARFVWGFCFLAIFPPVVVVVVDDRDVSLL